MNNPKVQASLMRNSGFPQTAKQAAASMKILPKIDNVSKTKNINDLLLLRQNHTPLKITQKKPSFSNFDQQVYQTYEDSLRNGANQQFGKRLTQLRIDSSEEQKHPLQNKGLAMSQITFKNSSSSNQLNRNTSGIIENNSQSNFLQSPSIKSSMTKIPLKANSDVKMALKISSPITQLQIDADQNRLDFMLEKGMNFEKNSQLIKLKQDNYDLKKVVKKQDSEIRRLRQELEMLRQNGQSKQNSVQTQERHSSTYIQDESFLQMEKKIQQNELHRQQMQNQKHQHESEVTELQSQIFNLMISLKEAEQQIQILSSHQCGSSQVEQKEITPAIELIKEECRECQPNQNQLQEKDIQIKALETNVQTLRAQNESLFAESQSLREWQIKTKESHQREKEQYEKYIQEQSEELLKIDKELRNFKKLYDDLMEKIRSVKNNSDFSKVMLRNEYVLLKTEIVDAIERLNKERLDRINENAQQIQQIQQKYEEEKGKSNKLQDEVNLLNQHLDWLKKRGMQQSKQNGTFNYLGLSEEILSLKKVIDQHIQEIPNKDTLSNFENKVEEMTMLNQQMVDKINKIQLEEEKSRKATESVPLLKQFEIAQTKVEYHLTCAKCQELLEEAITCVPCGHNYCKKCHYSKESATLRGVDGNEADHEAAISCMKCGPSTMIYRNETMDDMISMYKSMKGVKEVMKIYLSQQ